MRIPAALLTAMFVAAISLGIIVIVIQVYPDVGILQVITHCAAGLCLGWIAADFALAHRRPALAESPLGQDIQAVLRMAAIVLGLVAIIIISYVAATEALRRTPYLFDYRPRWQTRVWSTGLFDLGMLAAAVLLAWTRIRDNQLVTVCFWILALAGLWLSLQLPASRTIPIDSGGSYPEMTRWGLPFMIWSALVIAGFSIIESVRLHHRRSSAWPDRLDRLTSLPPAWPGFHYSVGIIGVLVLILGCVHIVTFWATAAAFITGAAIMAMVARRWEENLADLSVGLLSLGIASLPLLWVSTPEHLAPSWFANVFARLIIGLAIATVFWHWLAGVWHQQLDNGQAWTTTGRLIRTAKRVGFLCGATALLVAMNLAFWPLFPRIQDPDNSLERWLWGLGAGLLLIGTLTLSALRSRKTTVAWLAGFATASLVAFILIRLGDHAIAQWWSRYWAPATAALAGLAILPATGAYRSERWRPFGEPLLVFAVLFGPIAALAGITFTPPQVMQLWIPAATFALLAVVYLLATAIPGPKIYLIPAILCAVMAVWRWT